MGVSFHSGYEGGICMYWFLVSAYLLTFQLLLCCCNWLKDRLSVLPGEPPSSPGGVCGKLQRGHGKLFKGTRQYHALKITGHISLQLFIPLYHTYSLISCFIFRLYCHLLDSWRVELFGKSGEKMNLFPQHEWDRMMEFQPQVVFRR